MVLKCGVYAVVLSFQQLMLFESQVMSGYFKHFPCCQKLKQEMGSLFPCKFVVDVFSELKQRSSCVFLELDANVKEIFIL